MDSAWSARQVVCALFTEETAKRLKMPTEARVPMGILVEIAARLAPLSLGTLRNLH